MAKESYVGISGVARKVTKEYVGVAGVARNVTKGYAGVSGVAREFFNSNKGKPAIEYEVGESVFLNFIDGTKEFIVVQQGNPNASVYDASCDGTWLLMKDIYSTCAFRGNGDYSKSDVHTELNSMYESLSAATKEKIKSVKIPYAVITSSDYSVFNSSNGLSVNLFLLSDKEVGFPSTASRVSGTTLSYFSGATNADRIAYRNGTAEQWWTRSQSRSSYQQIWVVDASGGTSSGTGFSMSSGVRPALIVDNDAII
jgi:hypothetical protein